MTEPADRRRSHYEVEERDGRYEIRTPSGRAVLVCHDAQSAQHQAALLNEAYRAGYKRGFKDGRKR